MCALSVPYLFFNIGQRYPSNHALLPYVPYVPYLFI